MHFPPGDGPNPQIVKRPLSAGDQFLRNQSTPRKKPLRSLLRAVTSRYAEAGLGAPKMLAARFLSFVSARFSA